MARRSRFGSPPEVHREEAGVHAQRVRKFAREIRADLRRYKCQAAFRKLIAFERHAMANWQHLVASGKLAPRNTRARGNTLPRSIGTTSISLNVYDDFTRVCQVVRRVNRRNMRDD